MKNRIPQKNNFFKDYLEEEYIKIAKNHMKKEELNAKWDNLAE